MSVSSNWRKALTVGAFASVLLSTGAAHSACYSDRAGLSPQAVADFMANPGGLLQGVGQNDTARLTSRVRDLVATNPATLPVIISLLGGTNPALQTAMGAGLGQAARICTRNDPEFARTIQKSLADSNVQPAIVAAAGASGDRPTGSDGPGGGGGGGGVGGSVGGGAPGGGGGGGGQGGQGQAGNGTNTPTQSSGNNNNGGTAGFGSTSGQSSSP